MRRDAPGTGSRHVELFVATPRQLQSERKEAGERGCGEAHLLASTRVEGVDDLIYQSGLVSEVRIKFGTAGHSPHVKVLREVEDGLKGWLASEGRA